MTEASSLAPKGWKVIELGHALLGIDAGVSPKALNRPAEGDEIGVLKVSAVTWNEFRPYENKALPSDFDATDYPRVKRGDLLLSRANTAELLAAPVIARDDYPNLLLSDKTLRLVANSDIIYTPFLLYLLRTNPIRQYFVSRAMGTSGSMRNVSQATIYACPIALPPLADQRRIADVLDRAEALRAKRRAALAELDALTTACFFSHFGVHSQTPVTVGDKLHAHSRGWKWELLLDVARLATGHTPDRKRADYWNGDIPWITLSEIRKLDGTIATETAEHLTQAGVDHSAAVRLPAGTVCFSRTASIGFVTVMGKEMTTSQDFVNWVCAPHLEPIYLMHALLQSRTRLRSLSTGSTHKTIYFPVVERFRVLVPPIQLQRAFVAQVAVINKLRSAQRASLAELDSLFSSLQHRAFRGEL